MGRLRMVRRLEAGERLRDVAAAIDLSTTSVRRWWRRYRQDGVAGLMGVSRANLCMFAEPSGEWVGGFATPSFTRYGSVNNLLINYT
jgi:hypothetical protein